ncbi:MAG: TetR/AcrR family transcriptional regulator [Ilumatobacteraceae bacterium]
MARLAMAARGYEAATNRNLGVEAGLTAGAIYHYFASKLDLYVAVHEDAAERVYSRLSAATSGLPTFRGRIEAVLEASHEMNREDPSLAQFLGAVRVDMRRNPELRKALQKSDVKRASFFDSIIDVGLETGEIDPSNRDQVSALVFTLLVGLTDAVSDDISQHRLAVDGIKALLAGKLIRPVSRRATTTMVRRGR